ncbi:MAG: hypothetical protein AAF996_07985 [Pseudomonadota bacterium]
MPYNEFRQSIWEFTTRITQCENGLVSPDPDAQTPKARSVFALDECHSPPIKAGAVNQLANFA